MKAVEAIRFLSSKTWRIERTIFDWRLDFSSNFIGGGSLVTHDSVWIYSEQGELFINGGTYLASRRYIYELQNNCLIVRFEDGRPFYQADCSHLPEVSFEHLCGRDKYVGTLVIGSESWESSWQVEGPNKNLEILSRYS